jgi:protein tyrosine phosphatase (PTP) superfamily phosphohydrolase (DUF442 family)
MRNKLIAPIGLLFFIPCIQCASLPPAVESKSRPADWAQPIASEGLPNLHRVSGALYRGAQPNAGGIAELKKRGIKTVVNLRKFHSDEGLLEGAGIQSKTIPMDAARPRYEDALAFLSIVANPKNQPVFVHCQHGADRTGVLCAIYRIAVMNWTKDKAIEEMTRGDFGYHAIFNTSLIPFLQSIDIEQLKKDAGLKR